MSSKAIPTMAVLTAQREKIHREEERLYKLCEQAFPPGRIVQWHHGRHVREATVLDVNRDRLYVQSMAGKQYWLPSWFVEQG